MDDQYIYTRDLQRTGTFVELSGSAAALKDDKEWYVVYKRLFTDDNFHQKDVLVCSCKRAWASRARIEALDAMSDDIDALVAEEIRQYCKHCLAAAKLIASESSFSGDLNNFSDSVQQLCRNPLTYSVYAEGRYGFVVKGRSTFKCVTCKSTTCAHSNDFHVWCNQNDIDDPFATSNADSTDPSFTSISALQIPLELSRGRRAEYDNMCVSLSNEYALSPDYELQRVCSCGNTFSDKDPEQEGWKLKSPGTIYMYTTSYTNIKVYYRPTIGSCSCKQFVDGNRQFLLNLDNKHFIHHGYLMSLLLSTSEARFPLRAASRITARLHKSYSLSPAIPYHVLRRGYNAFTRYFLLYNSQFDI